MRTRWGIVYTLVASTGLGGIGLVCIAAVERDTALAVAGLVAFLIALSVFRLNLDLTWLKDARTKLDADREQLNRDRMVLFADRTIFDRERERTLHDLDEREQRGIRDLAEQVVRFRAKIDAEREQMYVDFENHVAEHDREVFETAYGVITRGLQEERQGAKVIALPRPKQPDTTMGTGTLNS